MSELGESTDPRALVPGDAESLRDLARALTVYAGDLRDAGAGLRAVGTPSGWRGRAAEAFREQYDTRAPRWLEAGDAFTAAARTLSVHAETLTWAQRQAEEAVRLWASGEAARPAARDTLDRARAQLLASGDDAAARLVGATQRAPLTPWGHVGAFGDAALDAGRDIVNAAASVGNAGLHDPGSIAAVLGGAGMIALGAGGTVGGTAVTATGVGAPVGVPAAAVSIGLVTTGTALAGAGAVTVAQSASGPDRVEPLAPGGGGSGPAPTPAAQKPAVGDPRLGNIVDPLYRGTGSPTRTGNGTTADAVRWERSTGGEVGGKVHIKKANESVRALRNWLRRNPDASPRDRGIAQQEYDSLLDALGRTR